MRKRIEPRKNFEGFQQLMIMYWGLFPKESLKSNHKCQKTFKKVMGGGGVDISRRRNSEMLNVTRRSVEYWNISTKLRDKEVGH